MKSLNGLVFIVLGTIAVWIGATGRLPAFAAALGMVRAKPGESGVTAGSSSTASAPAPAATFSKAIGAPDRVIAGSSTTAPISSAPFYVPWQQALKDIGW